MSQNLSAIVIGGGVIGLCTAYELTKSGVEVTVIEATHPDSIGCSSLNAGMIVPSHVTPLATASMLFAARKLIFTRNGPLTLSLMPQKDLVDWYMKFIKSCLQKNIEEKEAVLGKMHMLSRSRFLELEVELDHEFQVFQRGLFNFCKTEKAFQEESHTVDLAKKLGIRAELVSKEEIRIREPKVTFEVIGGVHHLDDCHFDPVLFMTAIRKKLMELGVAFIWNAEVEGFDSAGDQVSGVHFQGKTLAADQFVIAGGSWSSRLAKNLGISLPLVGGKGYSFTVEQPPQPMGACCLLHEARVAVTPMAKGIRFAGTMEIGSPSPIGQIGMRTSKIQAIRASIPSFMPKFQQAMEGSETVSAGLRPLSPDGLPYIGHSQKYSNVWIGTGHGMMGMSLGPVTGLILSRQMTGTGEMPKLEVPHLDGVSNQKIAQYCAVDRF